MWKSEILEFLVTMMRGAADYLSANTLDTVIIVITQLFFLVFNLYLAWKAACEYRAVLPKVIYMLIMLLGSLLLSPIMVIFFAADEIIELNPEIVSFRFSVEIIILIAVETALMTALARSALKRQGKQNDKYEVAKANGSIFWGALYIIVTILFMSTNAEFLLQDWGFSLFGKTLGRWIYNLYLSIILGYLTDLAKTIISTPVFAVFGNPYAHINDFIEEEQEY